MSFEWHLVIDCADPDRLADFWAGALGYEREGGIAQYRSLVDPDGHRAKLLLQQVPEAKSMKNRLHLDIAAPDLEAEAARLEALGAVRRQREPHHEFGFSWILMEDPEGNEFCIVPT